MLRPPDPSPKSERPKVWKYTAREGVAVQDGAPISYVYRVRTPLISGTGFGVHLVG